MIVIVEGIDRFESNLVVFRGREQETGRPVLFAADQRPAREIISELVHASSDGDSAWLEPLPVEIEPWQVL